MLLGTALAVWMQVPLAVGAVELPFVPAEVPSTEAVAVTEDNVPAATAARTDSRSPVTKETTVQTDSRSPVTEKTTEDESQITAETTTAERDADTGTTAAAVTTSAKGRDASEPGTLEPDEIALLPADGKEMRRTRTIAVAAVVGAAAAVGAVVWLLRRKH